MLVPPALGFLAGALSTLSPCVLPLLPILLGGALQQHRLAPAALAVGLATSFTVVGVAVASLGFAAGIDAAGIRLAAAAVMAVFGLVLLSGRLQAAFAGASARVGGGAGGLLARMSGEGLGGQFVLGLVLGAVCRHAPVPAWARLWGWRRKAAASPRPRR